MRPSFIWVRSDDDHEIYNEAADLLSEIGPNEAVNVGNEGRSGYFNLTPRFIPTFTDGIMAKKRRNKPSNTKKSKPRDLRYPKKKKK